jgi:hypothetical protein
MKHLNQSHQHHLPPMVEGSKTVLRCAALRCAAPRCAALCCAVRYGMVWYGMVWYGMVWFVAHCTLTCPGQAAELVACIIWTALSYNMHSRATYYHYRASERSSE